MEFGICHLNCIALRKDPSDQSEMVSQLLFGETFRVIEDLGLWIKIQADYDYYEGWISLSQAKSLDENTYHEVLKNNAHFSNEMVTFVSDKKDQLQIISLGASLPLYTTPYFTIDDFKYSFDGEVISGKTKKSNLVQMAHKYLNTPFLWGGKTPFGIDCSGFTQMIYKLNGYQLFRDAHQQASQGEVLSFIEESEPGDLAFFDNEVGEIIHVGILLADNYIIHCHGKVRIDRIDSSGIYNVDSQRHTHSLRVMKQIF
jgi:hypothetical protein